MDRKMEELIISGANTNTETMQQATLNPRLSTCSANSNCHLIDSVSGSCTIPLALNVVDVYEAASDIGRDLEHLSERYGRESIEKLVPKICSVLEQLEQYAARADKDLLRINNQQLQAALEAIDLYRQERHKIRDHHQHVSNTNNPIHNFKSLIKNPQNI